MLSQWGKQQRRLGIAWGIQSPHHAGPVLGSHASMLSCRTRTYPDLHGVASDLYPSPGSTAGGRVTQSLVPFLLRLSECQPLISSSSDSMDPLDELLCHLQGSVSHRFALACLLLTPITHLAGCILLAPAAGSRLTQSTAIMSRQSSFSARFLHFTFTGGRRHAVLTVVAWVRGGRGPSEAGVCN